MADKQKVFISWSGDVAKAVAHVWRALIKETFDNVTPFMSEDDIGAGERGLDKIGSELADSSFGIIVVTQQNQGSQWLNYEAGSLSKDLGDRTIRVAPCVVDFEKKGDVTGPIGAFQANLLDKTGVSTILVEIGKSIDADWEMAGKRFDRAWDGEYEQRFLDAKSSESKPDEGRRDIEDVADEILTIVRELARDRGKRITLGGASRTIGSADVTVADLVSQVKAASSVTGGLERAKTEPLQDIIYEYDLVVVSAYFAQDVSNLVIANYEMLGREHITAFKNKVFRQIEHRVNVHSAASDQSCG